MRTHVIARKTHKWFGLFVGLQVVVWSPGALQGGEYAGQINRQIEHPLSTLEQEILELI